MSDPAKDFNACDDFIVLVITSHILAASLEMLSMQSLDDIPVLPLLPPKLQNEPQKYQDSVQDYAIHLLSLGCFYIEYADAIREGDGGRVLCCR